jgi:hypothetical protein
MPDPWRNDREERNREVQWSVTCQKAIKDQLVHLDDGIKTEERRKKKESSREERA